jgi:fibronectin type 3 domain-containing protein
MKLLKLVITLLLLSAPLLAQPHPSVTLAWSWSQGTGDPATGFHVQRSATTGGPYVTVATVLVGTLTYLDTTVTVGATYFYVVTSYNSAGDSAKSAEVACTLPFQIPGAPSSLSGTVK